jgi:hypothetical protein
MKYFNYLTLIQIILKIQYFMYETAGNQLDKSHIILDYSYQTRVGVFKHFIT